MSRERFLKIHQNTDTSLHRIFITYRNMRVYYTGFNASPMFSDQNGIITSISQLTEIPFPEITNIEIGWNYFLLWRDTELYITGRISEDENDERNGPRLIQIPQESSEK